MLERQLEGVIRPGYLWLDIPGKEPVAEALEVLLHPVIDDDLGPVPEPLLKTFSSWPGWLRFDHRFDPLRSICSFSGS